MAICPSCGSYSTAEICSNHHTSYEDQDWCKNNKAVCDWVHRRIELPRLKPEEREDDGYWIPVTGVD